MAARLDISGSEDEFPDIVEVIRRQKSQPQKPDTNKENDDAPSAGPAPPKSVLKQSSRAILNDVTATPAVKATPLRRRKLGFNNPIDATLSKPVSTWDLSPEKLTRTARGKTPGKSPGKTPGRQRETVNRSFESSVGDIDYIPERARQRSGPVMPDIFDESDEAPDAKSKSRMRLRDRLIKSKTRAVSGTSSNDVSTCPSSRADSSFNTSADRTFDQTATTASDFSINQDLSRSDSDSDVFGSKNKLSPTKRGEKQARFALPSLSQDQTILDSEKSAVGAGMSQDNTTNGAEAQKPKEENKDHSLEDAFRKLSIFNEEPAEDAKTALPPVTPAKKTRALLTSPSKIAKIPLSPLRAEEKEFWDPEVNFSWIDKHSPQREQRQSPKKKKLLSAPSLSLDDPAALKKHYGSSPQKRDAKKAFDAAKDELARSFLQELDERITEGKLAELTRATGGLRIEWSNTLQTTAGRAHWRCKAVTRTTRDAGTGAAVSSATEKQHSAHIELATKVLANEGDLLQTVAHEFCHLAVFMLEGKVKNPHGAEFKAWGRRASAAFADRGIAVTTKHAYEIDYKYVWRCAGCSAEVRRHSRSVNPLRQRCGDCRGTLVQVKPTPRGSKAAAAAGGEAGAGPAGATTTTTTSPNPWTAFMKAEMAAMKETHKGLGLEKKMEIISGKWEAQKAEKKRLEAEKMQQQQQQQGSDQTVIATEQEPEETQVPEEQSAPEEAQPASEVEHSSADEKEDEDEEQQIQDQLQQDMEEQQQIQDQLRQEQEQEQEQSVVADKTMADDSVAAVEHVAEAVETLDLTGDSDAPAADEIEEVQEEVTIVIDDDESQTGAAEADVVAVSDHEGEQEEEATEKKVEGEEVNNVAAA